MIVIIEKEKKKSQRQLERRTFSTSTLAVTTVGNFAGDTAGLLILHRKISLRLQLYFYEWLELLPFCFFLPPLLTPAHPAFSQSLCFTVNLSLHLELRGAQKESTSKESFKHLAFCLPAPHRLPEIFVDKGRTLRKDGRKMGERKGIGEKTG